MVVSFFDTAIPAVCIRKRFGLPNPYGKIQRGVSLYGIGRKRNGIYKQQHLPKWVGGVRTHKYFKVINKKMAFYPYIITHKPEQDALRTKFAAAMAGWKSLTDEQRAVYNQRARNKKLFGFNLYIREYMLS